MLVDGVGLTSGMGEIFHLLCTAISTALMEKKAFAFSWRIFTFMNESLPDHCSQYALHHPHYAIIRCMHLLCAGSGNSAPGGTEAHVRNLCDDLPHGGRLGVHPKGTLRPPVRGFEVQHQQSCSHARIYQAWSLTLAWVRLFACILADGLAHRSRTVCTSMPRL